MSERTEAWMRLFVGIVSGILLGLWRGLVQFLVVLHWVYVILTGRRSRGLAEFCNLWPTQLYRFSRYMLFTTNERPFPFTPLGSVKDKVDFKK